ncbi:hypothetical protein [Halomicrobium urmianum]|uniref:hypothetical protein n=1 Tax=Halomicrobium urmianum TaxID=1586233 RepID=UPI001CD986B2|nr:hypothetical protein [Halomicrobium urmianum]
MNGESESTDGVLYRLQPIYNRYVRPHLPRTVREYNGVAVKDRALLDQTPAYPDFEAESVRQLSDAVEAGDDVVIVGGGRGVTAVYAVQSGADGVRIFEAAREYVDLARDTAARNGVGDSVAVEHAVVGDAVDLWGDAAEARRVAAADLPDCDVLELDCEGAEVGILESLGPRPRSLVVECHPAFGAPVADVRDALPDEYRVAETVVDEYDDLPVLRAEREDA